MAARILDGRAVADAARAGLADRVKRLLEGGAPRPRLALVEFDAAGPQAVYAATLARSAGEIGADPLRIAVPAGVAISDLGQIVGELNRDRTVAGIVIVHPVPAHLDREEAVALIEPSKDVDGAHPLSAGRLVRGQSTFVPATALAVMAVLRHFEIPVSGRRAVVIGRSAVVGRPVAGLLLESHATVVVCHTRTADLASETRRAEILVAAAGSPGLVRAEMVREGCVVIDAGYNTTADGVVGDVDFAAVLEVASGITPVPGGVGRVAPMMVLEQTVLAAEQAAAWMT